jgi:hypothetical protein
MSRMVPLMSPNSHPRDALVHLGQPLVAVLRQSLLEYDGARDNACGWHAPGDRTQEGCNHWSRQDHREADAKQGSSHWKRHADVALDADT